ncbi:MAG: aldehyde dehydrogenase family protein [Desulfosoma sp.]
MDMKDVLDRLGIGSENFGWSTGRDWGKTPSEGILENTSPVDGTVIARVYRASVEEYRTVMDRALEAFASWRRVPAPKRGEIIRKIGLKLRHYKDLLGRLVSYENGKILQEGWGEVQEMIDMADFAVGLSRQLYGLTMHSERPSHRMYEQYHPLGPVGVITAFNFPVAVWSWNAFIAAVCGDVVVWKPASSVPLTAIAVQNIVSEVLKEENLPEGIFNLVIGSGSTIGEAMLTDTRLPLISITGSTEVGRHAATRISQRLGRYILELGGNNAIILTENADLKLAVPAIVFGAVGTAGQRCTTTRRLIIHRNIFDRVKEALLKAYGSLRIGNPLDPATHVGPLIDRAAVDVYEKALQRIRQEGGEILYGGKVLKGPGYESGCYVEPTLVMASPQMPVVHEETFAPILYLLTYSGDIDEAIEIQNSVPQGLSSAVFTTNLKEAEAFLSPWGSDCGIANVNIGTSGAEIGGAFGGEKDTGGGREAGSDAWKAYMRRQTVTINFGNELPLAQGIRFEI